MINNPLFKSCVQVELYPERDPKPESEDYPFFIARFKNDQETLDFVDRRFSHYMGIIAHVRSENFYPAVAAYLEHRYWELGGLNTTFVLKYYPLLVFHMFCPAAHLHEQIITPIVFPPLPPGEQMNMQSVFAAIDYEVGLLASMKRVFPLLGELFKWFDYSARLYCVALEPLGSGWRLRRLLMELGELSEDQAEALWQLRNVVLHSGTLYSRDAKGHVWRFRIEREGDILVADHTRPSEPKSLGRHIIVSISALLVLHHKLKRALLDDMVQNHKKYVLHPNFTAWIQRFWCRQYLPDAAEIQPSLHAHLPPVQMGQVERREVTIGAIT